MSDLKTILTIEPPIPFYETETRRVRAVTCPVCNGKGYNISPDWNEPNPKCHACDGIGFLDAEIMIKWIPTIKHNEKIPE